MSPALRGAVALQMSAEWVGQVGVFIGCPQARLWFYQPLHTRARRCKN